jgi:predicted RNA binding protein YcfA (HicA-like mRNA interferase family)
MNGFEKQVKEILRRYGWAFLRHGKGSHDIWGKGNQTVSVNHECRSRHTANGILRAAGISERI